MGDSPDKKEAEKLAALSATLQLTLRGVVSCYSLPQLWRNDKMANPSPTSTSDQQEGRKKWRK